MISRETLSAAVAGGILTEEQASRLAALERQRVSTDAEPRDDEKLRFISGFSDVFVTLGLVLFLTAASHFLSGLGATMVSAITDDAQRGPATAIVLTAGIAALSWGLAEYFTRVRRMSLPSIVLLLVFALSAFFFGLMTIGLLDGSGQGEFPRPGKLWDDQFSLVSAGAGLIAIVLIGLYYWRFRVPITIAAAAAATGITVLSLIVTAAPELAAQWLRVLILVMGLGVFALAMRFDFSDTERLTRRTDIAFWLHLLAAPLIVHSLLSGFTGPDPQLDIGTAVAILALFLVLGTVAVLIDRRALLVSGLIYAGYAFYALLRETGLTDTTVPATMLILGAFVLLLSAGWRPLRAALLTGLPKGVAARLPNPLAPSTT